MAQVVRRARGGDARAPWRAALAVGCALGVGAGEAGAQQVDATASRRVWLEQAQAARAAGEHARALDLALRAVALEPTPSLRRFVADEAAAVGQYRLAMSSAERCLREAERDAASPAQADTLRACADLLRAARAHVGTVTVRPPQGAPDALRVRVAGEELPRTSWGAPWVVDPGPVVVEAEAPDRAPWRIELDVAAGASRTVDVALAPGPARRVPAPGVPRPRPAPRTAVALAGPVTVLALGAAGFATAAVLGVLRDDAYARCPLEGAVLHCPDDASRDALVGYNTATDAALVAAGAVAVAGVAWLVVALASGHAPAHVAGGLGVRASGRTGLVAGGAF